MPITRIPAVIPAEFNTFNTVPELPIPAMAVTPAVVTSRDILTLGDTSFVLYVYSKLLPSDIAVSVFDLI